MTIFAGIAEFERDLIRERTGAGREAAKKRGVRFGRPRKLALDQGELARRLVSEGKSVREIASVFNVHPATIYRLAAIYGALLFHPPECSSTSLRRSSVRRISIAATGLPNPKKRGCGWIDYCLIPAFPRPDHCWTLVIWFKGGEFSNVTAGANQ